MSDTPAPPELSSTALERQLSLAIKASEELLVLAQAESWQDFERQFRQRDTVLQRIDAEVTRQLPLSEEQGELIAARLNELRALNDKLLQTAEVSKKAIAQELAKDRKARQALNAYKKS
ncbi:flagellar protein FliT [Gilvimarinus japonicus]|uniref:Flagellar protein FliT n=1 Tax=Gilvimarinus japonicus TaxID=1796469 RepID=A0ABV7HQV7_9GAMM